MKLCFYCMKKDEHNISNFCERCGKPFEGLTPPAHHLPLGTKLCGGKYVVGAALGEGGFGITYIGRDQNLDMRVAIKEFYPSGFVCRSTDGTNTVSSVSKDDAETVFRKGGESFHSEARTLARLSGQPGIVNVRDFFRENNTVYIVMEYLAGQTLKQIVKSGKLFSEDEIKALLYPVMASLTIIHKESLLHRDISPDNIMIVNGQAKLIDFGAARGFASAANRSSSIIVKPGYAPIEQYGTKREQGPWTDVYAICATMYRCVTGKVPDIATDRVVSDDLKTPTQRGIAVSPEFERILMKGMSVLKKDRYQDITELMQALYSSASKNVAVVDAPVITPESGSYDSPLVVTMTCNTPGASIYFTVDGTDPVKMGQLYMQPITLSGADYITSNVKVTAVTMINGYVAGTTVRNYDLLRSNPLIRYLEAVIPVPTVGELFPRAEVLTSGVKITSMRWMDGDAPARDATFKENRYYSLMLTVATDEQHVFSDDLMASIGGLTAQVRPNPNGTVTIVRENIRAALDSATFTSYISRTQNKNSKKKKRAKAVIATISVLLVCAAACALFWLVPPLRGYRVFPNTSDITKPVLKINNGYYDMPVPVSVMLDNGWDMPENDADDSISAGSSKYILFSDNGYELRRNVTNDLDKDIALEDAVLYSLVINDDCSVDISLAGVDIGTKRHTVEQLLEDVEFTLNSSPQNDIYTFDGQDGSEIKVFVDPDTDVVSLISIEIIK